MMNLRRACASLKYVHFKAKKLSLTAKAIAKTLYRQKQVWMLKYFVINRLREICNAQNTDSRPTFRLISHVATVAYVIQQ